MKIRCVDGKVREFSKSEEPPPGFYGITDSVCKECGHNFGVHDTKILKPRWKEHVCKGKIKKNE